MSLIAPRKGELIGDAADRRVEILSDADSLNVTWSRFAAGREGADPHVHREHSDLFFVLSGELTMRLGPEDAQVPVPAGGLVEIPPGVVHGFRNASDSEVIYLNLHAPGMNFAGYMRSVRDGSPIAYDQFEPPEDGGLDPGAATIVAPPPAPLACGRRELSAGDGLTIAEVAAEPGGAPDRTCIKAQLSSIYVLAGELAVSCRGRELTVPAGSWLQFPHAVEHFISAAGDQVARYLEIHS